MAPSARWPAPSFKAGETEVRVFDQGDFPIDLGEVFGPDLTSRFLKPDSVKGMFPSRSMLVSTHDQKLVVDPGNSEKVVASMNQKPDPARGRPVALHEALTGIGIHPEEITGVVVTHLHFDHFAGITKKAGSGWAPAFPNAKCYIPRKDWEMPDIADGIKKKDKDIMETLGVVEGSGLLEFTDGRLPLSRGVAIEPCPGESPGHQIVSINEGGQTCYLIGDLYHVREEVEHPELVATWTDRPALIASRKAFAERAAKEKALVLSGHMGPGRISMVGSVPRWNEE